MTGPIVDLFAGGGGASVGIEAALGAGTWHRRERDQDRILEGCMRPREFPQANTTLIAPPGSKNIGELPVYAYRGGRISCWRFTWRDLWQAILYRRLWIHVLGSNHPPFGISTQRTVFEQAKKKKAA